jgi:hypothetical protein
VVLKMQLIRSPFCVNVQRNIAIESAEVIEAMTEKSSAARKLKYLTIFAVVLWGGLVFLAWSQSWFTLKITGQTGESLSVDVPGSVAAPALSALALAGLALAAALAIAGPLVRVVLGILELLIGVSIAWSGLGALIDPVLSGSSAVTGVTGIAGTESIRSMTQVLSQTFWPPFTVIVGVLMVITGILIAMTVTQWPTSCKRYQAILFESEDGQTSGNLDELVVPADTTPDSSNTAAVDSWDTLSHGEDPTR